MRLKLDEREWRQRDDLAEAFEARYHRRPAVRMKDTLVRLFDAEGREVSVATLHYTVELKFPVEQEVFELREEFIVRLHDDEGTLELVEELTNSVWVNGLRLFKGARFLDAEAQVLDTLSRRQPVTA